MESEYLLACSERQGKATRPKQLSAAGLPGAKWNPDWTSSETACYLPV